jgi:hypothetical protein
MRKVLHSARLRWRPSRSPSAGRTASNLYRLYLALGIFGAASVVMVAATAIIMIRPGLADDSVIWQLCARLLSELDLLSMAVLLVLSGALTVVFFGLNSLVRQLRAGRRLRSRLVPVDTIDVDGSTVTVVDDEHPEAFCMGYLRPTICVSTRALELLSENELKAVIAHERYHIAQRDPLRVLLGHVAAEALVFIPALPRLLQRYLALAELAADEAAVNHAGTQPLASALLSFGEHRTSAAVVGIAPERVDHLGGEPARWRFSASWIALWMFISAGVFALAVIGAMLVQGRSLTAMSMLLQACFVGMIGMPLLAGLLALIRARQRRRERGDQ